MGKKIIFACPTHFGLNKMIIDNLKHHGFEVYSLCIDESFKYKNLSDKIINFIRKTFFKDKGYKKKLYYEYQSKLLKEKITSFNQPFFNYSLFIRPDIYPLEIINIISKISSKNIGYQWDGLNRFSTVFNRIDLFDKFYVFDKSDFKKYKSKYNNLHYTDNFYSDLDSYIPKKTIDVFYIGMYDKDRFDDLFLMYQSVKKLNLSIDIQLKSNTKIKTFDKNNTDISFFTKQVSYQKSLQKVKFSRILLDVLPKHHSGLSFRFFESIKYKCKIITNNKSIKEYDFYHPNNIFILHEDDINLLPNFITSEFIEMKKSTLKYSFNNWINNLLK